jgi:hypothetical protein
VVEELVKKIPSPDGFQRFIALFTKAPEPVESTPLYCTKLFNNNFNIILPSTCGYKKWFVPASLYSNILYVFINIPYSYHNLLELV